MNRPSTQEQFGLDRGRDASGGDAQFWIRRSAGCPEAWRAAVRRLQTALVALLLICVTAGSAAGQVPIPGQGSSKGRPGDQLGMAPTPVFEFHSGFWMNLHHALYEEARIREQRPTERPTSSSLPAKSEEKRNEASSKAQGSVSAEEERAWNEAVDYYVATLARRDLLFDGEMVDTKNQLAELENCKDLSGRSGHGCAALLRPEQVAALEKAAPFYRARWWAEHDGTNRAWIATVSALVRDLGRSLAEQLSTVYRCDWPNGKIRVDVTHYAGLFGGYTSLEPLHITISGADERNQGLAALQVLFHEASHALAGGVRDILLREYRLRGKPIPRELWEAILYYTVDELMKRVPANKESAPTRKRANEDSSTNRSGLRTRGWQNFQATLERHWKPYLDTVTHGGAGPDDFDRALARVVDYL